MNMRAVVSAIAVVVAGASVSLTLIASNDGGSTGVATSSSVASSEEYKAVPVKTLEDRVYQYEKTAVRSFTALEGQGYICLGLPVRAGSGASLGLLNQSRPDIQNRSGLDQVAGDVYDCLLTCLPADPTTWGSPDLGLSTPCMDGQISGMSKVLEPSIVFAASDALMHDYPELSTTCHQGAHDAGKNAVIKFDLAVPEALRLAPKMGRDCLYGFMHGVLETIGFTKSSTEVLKSVVKECQKIQDTGAAGECIHGLGHAAWDLYLDVGKVVDGMCGELPTQQFVSCSYGIVMRRFELSELNGDLKDHQAVFDDAIKLCTKEWPDGVNSDGTYQRYGCYRNVPFIIWYPLAMSKQILDMDEAQVREYVKKATQVCLQFPSIKPGTSATDSVQNHCDIETGRYLAEAAEFDQVRGYELCTYSAGNISLCREQLDAYISESRAIRVG